MAKKLATPANQLICALETHLVAAPGGWDDRRGLARFKRLALELMATLEDPRERERVRAACNWAEVLYSTRGHQRQHRGLAWLHLAVLSNLEHVRQSLNKYAPT